MISYQTTYSEQVGMSFAEVETHHSGLSPVDTLWKLQDRRHTFSRLSIV